MTIVNGFIFFIGGTIFGSFINVLVLRYNTGLSFVSGRSKCFSCGKTLTSGELIPLFSFIFLGGKCSACKSKISYQYPLVELITGIFFVLTFLRLGMVTMLPFYLLVVSTLIAISVYDLKHKIIPDGMVFFFDAIAFIFLLVSHQSILFSMSTFLDFWAGLVLFAFFAFFWLVSDGKWMGFGDAKLALGVGWFLGFYMGISAIMLAFWIGALISLILLGLQRLNISRFGLTIKSEIPFAPFIIFAFFLELFTGWNLFLIMHMMS